MPGEVQVSRGGCETSLPNQTRRELARSRHVEKSVKPFPAIPAPAHARSLAAAPNYHCCPPIVSVRVLTLGSARATIAALASAQPFPSPSDAVALRVRSSSSFCCLPRQSFSITRDPLADCRSLRAVRPPTTPRAPSQTHDANQDTPADARSSSHQFGSLTALPESSLSLNTVSATSQHERCSLSPRNENQNYGRATLASVSSLYWAEARSITGGWTPYFCAASSAMHRLH